MMKMVCGSSYEDKEHTTDDARIVSLEEVYALDPSIGEVADMPCGCYMNKK